MLSLQMAPLHGEVLALQRPPCIQRGLREQSVILEGGLCL